MCSLLLWDRGGLNQKCNTQRWKLGKGKLYFWRQATKGQCELESPKQKKKEIQKFCTRTTKVWIFLFKIPQQNPLLTKKKSKKKIFCSLGKLGKNQKIHGKKKILTSKWKKKKIHSSLFFVSGTSRVVLKNRAEMLLCIAEEQSGKRGVARLGYLYPAST